MVMPIFIGLLLPTLLATRESSGTCAQSSLLHCLKRTLASELNAIGLDPLHFHHSNLYDLRGDLDALRDGIELHKLSADYFGATVVSLEVNGPPEAEPPKSERHFDWVTCDIRAGFLSCALSEVLESPATTIVLFDISVSVSQWKSRYTVGPMLGVEQTAVVEKVYALRSLSQRPESRFLVCPEEHAHCQVEVHLRQIRSLSAFEAQLERVAGLMDEVETEEMHQAEACQNLTCFAEVARKATTKRAASANSEEANPEHDNLESASTPPSKVDTVTRSWSTLETVAFYALVVLGLLWSPLFAALFIGVPIYVMYTEARRFLAHSRSRSPANPFMTAQKKKLQLGSTNLTNNLMLFDFAYFQCTLGPTTDLFFEKRHCN
ncbi:hypothetical protein AAVH_13246 [Aphelenchoides avenae]|nr:hypothetical protein AAVH_13246 [Aphelenchus avenae]